MGSRKAKIPPFIDEEAERIIQETRHGLSSYIVMAFGWALLTVALVGGAYLAYDYINRDPKLESPSVLAPLVILAIAYLAGWIVSLVSIRVFYNLIMPVVIKVYSFGVLAGILFVYGSAISKILMYQADKAVLPTEKYFWVLLAGYLLLVSMHLLVSDLLLAPHAIILLIGVSGHLVVAVYHHVFNAPTNPILVTYDVSFLISIVIMAILLTQKWLYRPLRVILSHWGSAKRRVRSNEDEKPHWMSGNKVE